MITLDLPQGSPEWLLARSAIPSASMFGSIVTSAGKPSTSAGGYMNQLLAEWIVGGPVDQVEANYWMNRGNELEDEARQTYSFITDNQVDEVGFCYKDERKLVGCSPDGLISTDGMTEIKCPKASTMVEYLLANKLPAKYKPQVQGQLWVTGREWSDFVAYHPQLKPMIIHVERDEKYITALEELIEGFIETMLKKREQLAEFKLEVSNGE